MRLIAAVVWRQGPERPVSWVEDACNLFLRTMGEPRRRGKREATPLTRWQYFLVFLATIFSKPQYTAGLFTSACLCTVGVLVHADGEPWTGFGLVFVGVLVGMVVYRGVATFIAAHPPKLKSHKQSHSV
mmetsp:Transcript_20855/g.46578  ORF Transcript_20855/g.46578 Transcript_20855/m.46578 type:complete len:129 (-) Transcript_20855:43-429(-)